MKSDFVREMFPLSLIRNSLIHGIMIVKMSGIH